MMTNYFLRVELFSEKAVIGWPLDDIRESALYTFKMLCGAADFIRQSTHVEQLTTQTLNIPLGHFQ